MQDREDIKRRARQACTQRPGCTNVAVSGKSVLLWRLRYQRVAHILALGCSRRRHVRLFAPGTTQKRRCALGLVVQLVQRDMEDPSACVHTRASVEQIRQGRFDEGILPPPCRRETTQATHPLVCTSSIVFSRAPTRRCAGSSPRSLSRPPPAAPMPVSLARLEETRRRRDRLQASPSVDKENSRTLCSSAAAASLPSARAQRVRADVRWRSPGRQAQWHERQRSRRG